MIFSNKLMSEELKQELHIRLKQIDPNVPEKMLNTWGNMSLELLADDENKLNGFLATMEWFSDALKTSSL